MAVTKVLKVIGKTKADRAEQRQQLGTLRLLTVTQRTRTRYEEALRRFHRFLRLHNLTLPRRQDHIDTLVSDYLEHLWSTGEGKGEACNFLAAIQDS